MFEKIIFYNGASFGDNCLSRSLVKYVVQNIPSKEYIYHIRYTSKILKDIDGLTFKEFPDNNLIVGESDGWKIIDNILYVNTWCIANNFLYHKKNGCTLTTLYNIFRDGIKFYCNHDIPNNILEFVPDINFLKFEISNVNSFFENRKNLYKNVLIANGKAQAGQSSDFDFDTVVNKLSDILPDYTFFMSNYPKNIYKNNVFYCKDIININENDIVESSYFGNFCEFIIGRASGVYTYCLNKDNLIINPKQFICFCKSNLWASLGIKKYLSQNVQNNINNFIVFREDEIISIIYNIIVSNQGKKYD